MQTSKIKKILLNYPILFSINFAIIMMLSHIFTLYDKLGMIYYVIIGFLAYIMYTIERNLLDEKFEPRTTEKLIDDAWKNYKKETKINKKEMNKIIIPRWIFDKLSNIVKDRIVIEKIEEHCVTILCFDESIVKYITEFTHKVQLEKEIRELEGLQLYLRKKEEKLKGK